jgi:hypothetical protein
MACEMRMAMALDRELAGSHWVVRRQRRDLARPTPLLAYRLAWCTANSVVRGRRGAAEALSTGPP